MCHLSRAVPGSPQGLWTKGSALACITEPTLTWQPDPHRILERWCPTAQMSPTWKGHFTVLLSTPTTVKVPGVSSWTHHSRIKAWKGEEGGDLPTGSQSSCKALEDLKLLFKKVPLSTDD